MNQLDAQFKRGAAPAPAEFARLRDDWQTLLDEIDTLERTTAPAPASTAAPPLPHPPLQTLVEHLIQALGYDLGAVEPLLAELRAAAPDAALAAEIAAIAEQFEVFAIDEALVLAAALCRRLDTKMDSSTC